MEIAKERFGVGVVPGLYVVRRRVAVEFSLEECKQFLGALPNWLFDEMRLFAGNPSNFAEMIDVQVSSKN